MAGAKEIRVKIKSIKSTQKITRAMEMVAASKMRRAQERMRATRPYAERIRDVIAHLASGRLEYKHQYLMVREPRNVGFIVISTDRGLCGGLNANLLRTTVAAMRKWDKNQIPIQLCTIGRKAEGFFRRMGGNVVASLVQIGDRPGIQDIIGTVKVMLDEYDAGNIDRLFLVYNKFINTMKQSPQVELLLPVMPTAEKRAEVAIEHEEKERAEIDGFSKMGGEKHNVYSWDYIYEPDAKQLLDALLIRYIESLVFQGVVENNACEQAARMVAMKNATENSKEIINELQLMYNKARQASITREISEIVAGAAAVG